VSHVRRTWDFKKLSERFGNRGFFGTKQEQVEFPAGKRQTCLEPE
jgi:hypothetical protein